MGRVSGGQHFVGTHLFMVAMSYRHKNIERKKCTSK